MFRKDNAARPGGIVIERDACDPMQRTASNAADLVVVRQEVLAAADHAFGNLFQRLYHLLRTARAGGDHALSSMEESVKEFESLLELFVDYVAPIAVDTRELSCMDLSTSLRRHLEGELGAGRVEVEERGLGAARVAVDPSRFTRVFQLLARLLGDSSSEPVRCICALSVDKTDFEIEMRCASNIAVPQAELRRGLVEKLVELHGGTLQHVVTAEGVTLVVQLPTVDS